MTIDEMLDKLDGVREEADGYVVCCPAHGDRSPSLKITPREDGRVLVVCRAGCAQADVLAALEARGIPRSALRSADVTGARVSRAGRPDAIGPGEIAGLRAFVDTACSALDDATTEYAARRFGLTPEQCRELELGTSTTGRYEFRFVSATFTRYPRLTVPFRGFDGITRALQGRDLTGDCPVRWAGLMNPDGKAWARYGVFAGGVGYETVVITEGPGDALTAVGAGYDAIGIRGARVAGDELMIAELVDGIGERDVVIAGDRDASGRNFATALARALTMAGVPVRMLEIPRDGDDLTDWRKRDPGAFAAELHQAVRVAPLFVVDPEPAATESTTATAGESADLDVVEDARAAFDATDVGLAIRLRDHMCGGIRHAPGLGYLTWDGRRWVAGEMQVRQAIHHMGAALISSGRESDRKLALRALTNRAIDAVMAELPAIHGVRTTADEFDAHADLLSVRNGTVNLRTGELRPHSPDDMITQCLDIEYDPTAKAPRWESFLDEVFPNHSDMPAYIRRVIGYGITGHTAEQCYFFHHGGGKNGKSAYLDTLLYVFKGISRSTEFTTFEQRTSVGQASPEVAGLRGYRLVMASETEKYNRLAESLMKQLTGGDAVTARFLNQNPFTFTPRFLLQVAGNYKPAIVSQDQGIWRRVRLIPWEAEFHGAARDKQLPAKLRGEAAGILAWAVRGAQEWYAAGLGEPTSVREATDEYRESEDRLAEFVEAALVVEDGATITPTELRNAYKAWMEEAGFSNKEILAGRSLGVEMESRGWPQKRTKARRFHAGIRVKTETEKHKATADEAADIFGQSRR
ncbi:phage/plasmid primase, P4 family [Streptomyces sp. SM12]|uniref:phage/plasmid primase, P4 family n=1 Tax=Streptomyces sp. SM12 TaxID=1071602 RepID=UPI000CD4B474|nr:phage/plasmid primase, P4 family [Streptomyces sp. SM12]